MSLVPYSDESNSAHFCWPVYEIENFLLNPAVIRGAIRLLLRRDPFESDEEVTNKLRELATKLVSQLALDEVQSCLNREFVESLSIGGTKNDAANELAASAEASKKRIGLLDSSNERISKMIEESAARHETDIESDEFLVNFPEDRLLRALAGDFGINGDHFRNACLDQAQRSGYRPTAMEKLLNDALR